MTRVELLRALNAGRDAGLARRPVTDCPYPSGDLRRSAWVRGYAKGRPLPGEAAT
ncbi:Rmf/CrpP fold protein [Streptomyces sp. B1866]|uniref:Rmf/CrpP fold protein n=1 Tax=Streptomyces sp. B1866 TaxID=3075431 RepID=UPI00288E1180|nr:Rmf/CrpP fold protein [Streptomyces sp. B1866]MDT3395586.1 Rmf/CrpP fold protein [Streptomyces sp. B1866]